MGGLKGRRTLEVFTGRPWSALLACMYGLSGLAAATFDVVKVVVGSGFEPEKALARRFTVSPRWPLEYPTKKRNAEILGSRGRQQGFFLRIVATFRSARYRLKRARSAATRHYAPTSPLLLSDASTGYWPDRIF